MPFPAGELVAAIRMDGMPAFERDNARAESMFKRTGDAGSRAGESITRGLQTAAVATSAIAIAGGTYLTTLFQTGAAYNTLQQTSRAALRTLLGGAEAANNQMAKLDDFARNSPFSKAVFIQAQQQLLGFGVEAKRVIPILGAVQDAAAATGGTSQDIAEIVGVLAKIQSQGKITGEELLQLGGRGIDAAGLIGQAFGKTSSEMKEEISEGAITAEQALDALVAGMVKTYGGAAAEVKKTWDGAKDRIKAANREIGASLAEPFISQQGGGYAVVWANQVADNLRAILKHTTPIVSILEGRLLPGFATMTTLLDQSRVAIKSWDSSRFETFLLRADQYAPAIAGIAGAILGLTGRALAGIPILGGFLGALNPVLAALIGVAAASPEVREALGELFKTFSPLLPVFRNLALILASGLNSVLPVVAQLILSVTEVAEPLVAILAAIPPPLLAAVTAFIALNQAAGPAINALEMILNIGSALGGAVAWAWAEQMAQGVGKVRAGLTIAQGAAEGFAGALKSLFVANPATLIILGVTAAAALLTAAFAANAEQARVNNEAIAEYRETLVETTGALTAATEAQIRKTLADKGAVDAAEKLGLTEQDLVDAIMGSEYALLKVRKAYEENAGTTGNYMTAQANLGVEAGIVNNTVLEQARLLEEAQTKTREAAEAQREAAAAMSEFERSNERMNTALEIARDITKDATERLQALKQALDELNGGAKTAAEAEKELHDQTRQLQDAFNATNEAGEKIGGTLVDSAGKIDTTTAAGSRLFDAINGLNDEMLTAIQLADEDAKKRGEQGLSMEKANEVAKPYIDTLRTIGTEAGLSEPQVQGLIDTMLATPSVVAYALTDDGTIDANKVRLIDLASQIIATPDKQFEVSSDDFPGLEEALRILGVSITTLPSGQVTVKKDDGSFWSVEQALNTLARNRVVGISVSGNPVYRTGPGGRDFEQYGNLYKGGVAQNFGQGGFPSGIYPGRPGGIHKFAEPWLPWEAYISPDKGAREKNLRIHAQVGELLGADTRPTGPTRAFATGAFLPGGELRAPSATAGPWGPQEPREAHYHLNVIPDPREPVVAQALKAVRRLELRQQRSK